MSIDTNQVSSKLSSAASSTQGFTVPQYLLLALLLAVAVQSSFAAQADSCNTSAGRFMSMEGAVDVQSGGAASWDKASLETDLCEGDTVRVGDASRAAIALVNDVVLRIDERSSVRLVDIVAGDTEQSLLQVLSGAFHSFSRKPTRFTVSTPYINGSIEGTEFLVRVGEDSAHITVFEGVVLASNDHGSVSVAGGEQAGASAGSAPVKSIPVRPRDQVQWGLYYPNVLLASGSADIQRAATQLQAGRVDETRRLLQQVLSADAGNSDALALRAILKVVTLDDSAAADAEQAVANNPDSAAAYIALSYAYQAQFKLPEALGTLQAGAARISDSAQLLARLAEVQLMLDQRQQALTSAAQAVAINPDSARAIAVTGFAALAEFRPAQAQTAFERAIALNSANPMNHLGLGLAHISGGNLALGRQYIEAAVALDSNSALLRSYLGKAYFEEKRSELASEQLNIAAQLDANDPTSFLYSGIIKQTINRPVEAVQDLEQSRALNDNRAVFRSRLLLDRDEAARGTSLARAYQDLGFRQVATVEATKSLSSDPGNAAAHRFLADSYRGESRREVARVSELLQAQMLQDININPVQPSRSDTNLNIITAGGPAGAGFNEFTPLFERNRNQFNVTALGGNHKTWAGEAVASGTHGGFSYSAGAYRYETDGFRDNNDLKHEIYTLFSQYAITERLNVQGEYRHRESEYGDRALNVDPYQFAAQQDNYFEDDSYRLGLRWNINEATTLLLSGIYAERKRELTDSDGFATPEVVFRSDIFVQGDTNSNQLEALLLTRIGPIDLSGGVSWADVDKTDDVTLNITQEITLIPGLPPLIFEDEFEESLQPDPKDTRAYLYSYLSYPQNVTWTLGYSYQKYEEQDYDFEKNNIKAGVEWQPMAGLTLRGAYFEVVKPVLGSNRTLEPTQVAGFNQLYDDADATYSEASGLAADWKIGAGWYLGAQYTERDIESPSQDLNSGAPVFDDRKEERGSAYINWAPNERWALSLAYVSDNFENDADSIQGGDVPLKVETDSAPASVSYFHPNGLFATVTVTWVDQSTTSHVLEVGIPGFDDIPLRAEGDDSFSVTDITLGYRLPRRLGVASLVVQNVFDESFLYQDDGYRTFGDVPAMSPYAPELTGMLTVTLNF